MDERRKSKRLELESKLVMNRLTNGGNKETKEVAIEVIDISKAGVGFSCVVPLQIGEVYEGFLTIWTKEVLHSFIEIVRIEKEGDLYIYGGFFVGMPEMEANRIEIYEIFNEPTEK